MQPLQRCKPLLGTFVEVCIGPGPDWFEQPQGLDEQDLLRISDRAFAEIAAIQAALSFHAEDSELSAFNRWALSNPGGIYPVSPALRQVLQLALNLSRATAGCYDLCVAPALVADGQLPGHLPQLNRACGKAGDIRLTQDGVEVYRPLCIDLGGIAKGYAVDRALEVVPVDLDVVVNAGGDLRMRRWQGKKIGLRYGKRRGAQRYSPMLAPAVATSGDYFREGHQGSFREGRQGSFRSRRHGIIDPRTGKAKKRCGSVSVFATTAMLADALTKAVWLLPRGEAQNLLATYGARAVSINRLGMLKTLL